MSPLLVRDVSINTVDFFSTHVCRSHRESGFICTTYTSLAAYYTILLQPDLKPCRSHPLPSQPDLSIQRDERCWGCIVMLHAFQMRPQPVPPPIRMFQNMCSAEFPPCNDVHSFMKKKKDRVWSKTTSIAKKRHLQICIFYDHLLYL